MDIDLLPQVLRALCLWCVAVGVTASILATMLAGLPA